MRIDVLTLFPDMFPGVLGASILKRAAEAGKVAYHLIDIRDYSTDKHRKVDQSPYGGGPGMVMQGQPVWDAVRAAEAEDPQTPATRIVLTPDGEPLHQRLVEELAGRPRLLLIAGHYEGLDQRLLDRLHEDTPDGGAMREVSLGDYVLSGGELPAMVLIDAVVRLLPGVLGDSDSAHFDSFSPGAERRLDHPHYTRPATWDDRAVPGVLMSGDHKKIAAWRRERALERTRQRRPDLMGQAGGAGALPGAPIVVIREAKRGDRQAIDTVHRQSFETDAESRLVRRLVKEGDAVLSLVAEMDGEVVGHAMVSPARLAEQAGVRGLFGLGPVAVRAPWRGRGVGSALVRQALAEAGELGGRAVFVLGEPAFYSPLGFEPAGSHGFTRNNAQNADEPGFMIHPIKPLPESQRGPVRYAPAFEDMAHP